QARWKGRTDRAGAVDAKVKGGARLRGFKISVRVCGARIGVWMILVPSLRKISSNEAVNLLSRSWIRNLIRSNTPVKLRLRACWVTQAPVGLAVQPARWTRRLSSSMKNRT